MMIDEEQDQREPAIHANTCCWIGTTMNLPHLSRTFLISAFNNSTPLNSSSILLHFRNNKNNNHLLIMQRMSSSTNQLASNSSTSNFIMFFHHTSRFIGFVCCHKLNIASCQYPPGSRNSSCAVLACRATSH